MPKKIPFNKSYKSASELVTLLQSRGLFVENVAKAEQYLRTISYYRLSAYLYPLLEMPKSSNHFTKGSSFSKAMTIYRFDKKLRLLLFNEVEKIEIAVRTAIIDECTTAYGNVFWMTDENNFVDKDKFHKTLSVIDSELQKTHEVFIIHYKNKYLDPYPPAWMLAEIIPLGVLTNIFANLNNLKTKKNVAWRFGLPLPIFNSWLTIVTLTRNSCCHHARVWNRINNINPKFPKTISNPWLSSKPDTNRVYYNICIIKFLIDRISPNNDMKGKLLSLLDAYPSIDTGAMGFPKGWKEEPLWNH